MGKGNLKLLILCCVMPSAAGITGIGPTLALSHVGPYSSNACGLRHYPTHN